MTEQNPAIFIQAGTHPAEDVRRAFDVFIGPGNEGIVAAGDLSVTETGTPAMSVDVAGGRAIIQGTEGTYQGPYIVENRGSTTVTVTAADVSNPRLDLVVAKIEDQAYSGAVNAWVLAVVAGTPAASPVAPSMPANSILLATVAVGAAAATITNANITDGRTVAPAAYRAGDTVPVTDGGTGSTTASAARTALGVAYATGDVVPIAGGGSGATTASGARTALGVAIGSDVQAHSAVLDSTTAAFTTADETKLDGIETGADVTDAAAVQAAGALMDSETDANLKTLVLPASTTISSYIQPFLADTTSAAALAAISAQPTAITDAGGYITATTVDAAFQESFSGQYSRNRVTASGASQTLTLAPCQFVTLTANCTFTFATPTTQGHTFILRLNGAYTPTWPASVDWPNGTAPGYDSVSLFVFTTLDTGTNWLGALIGGGFA